MYYYKINNVALESEVELNVSNGYADAEPITFEQYLAMLNPEPILPTAFEIAKQNKLNELTVFATNFVVNGWTDEVTGYKLFTGEKNIEDYQKIATSIPLLPTDFLMPFGTYTGWHKEPQSVMKGLMERYTQFVYPITAKIMETKTMIEYAQTVEQIEAITW